MMDDNKLFNVATKIATPLSLASLSLLVLYGIYKAIVGMGIFPELTNSDTFQLLNNIINKLFILALVAMIIGVCAYIFTKRFQKEIADGPGETGGEPIPPNNDIKITFIVDTKERTQSAQLLGDFTAWEVSPIDMEPINDNQFQAVVYLEKEKRYRFKFKTDGEWKENMNDGYKTTKNKFGTLNYVIDVE